MIRVHRPPGSAQDDCFLVSSRRVNRGYIQRRLVEREIRTSSRHEASVRTRKTIEFHTFDLDGKPLRVFSVSPAGYAWRFPDEGKVRRQALHFLASWQPPEGRETALT